MSNAASLVKTRDNKVALRGGFRGDKVMKDLEELKNKVRSFCEERDWDQFHTPKELAIGLVTESSELLELFRFLMPSQVEELMKDSSKREKVEDELADIFFFLLRFSQLYQVDLLQAFENKISKTSKKYPIEKFKGSNLKYDEL